jgi:hypothetical protein
MGPLRNAHETSSWQHAEFYTCYIRWCTYLPLCSNRMNIQQARGPTETELLQLYIRILNTELCSVSREVHSREMHALGLRPVTLTRQVITAITDVEDYNRPTVSQQNTRQEMSWKRKPRHFALSSENSLNATPYIDDNIACCICNRKSKAKPLQAWTGPEGCWRLRLPNFKTIGTWRW